ncbi:MAG: hypothetical protein ACYDEY_09750 [Acidimicrobiales bacterium]
MHRTVVVVDDDDMTCRGMAEYLADDPGIQVIGRLSHEEALSWTSEWDPVDVAVVDAADESSALDQFPGVAVVEQIRKRRSPRETLIIVTTGHFFDDAVRERMREARADYLFHRAEFHDASVLVNAVLSLDADHGIPVPALSETMFQLGVTHQTRINDALRFAADEGLLAGSTGPARSRRQWITLRSEFNRIANLTPANSDGCPPSTFTDTPSMPQIARFLDWATKAKNRQVPQRNSDHDRSLGLGR